MHDENTTRVPTAQPPSEQPQPPSLPPLDAHRLAALVEDTLNHMFGGVADDISFDDLWSHLAGIWEVPGCTTAAAVEDALRDMEAANKIMYRLGRIHLI